MKYLSFPLFCKSVFLNTISVCSTLCTAKTALLIIIYMHINTGVF